MDDTPSTYPTPAMLDSGELDENGIDVSLIRENLRLTPLERIRKGDRARLQALRLLEVGTSHRRQENELGAEHRDLPSGER